MGWFYETENSSCAMGPRISADAVMVRAVVGNELAQSLKPNRIMSVSRLMWPSLVSDVVILCSVYISILMVYVFMDYIVPRPGEFKIEQQKLRAVSFHCSCHASAERV